MLKVYRGTIKDLTEDTEAYPRGVRWQVRETLRNWPGIAIGMAYGDQSVISFEAYAATDWDLAMLMRDVHDTLVAEWNDDVWQGERIRFPIDFSRVSEKYASEPTDEERAQVSDAS